MHIAPPSILLLIHSCLPKSLAALYGSTHLMMMPCHTCVSFRTVVSEAVSFGGLKPGRCSWITRLPGGHALARQVLAGTRQARGPLAPLPLPAVLHWILIQCSTLAQHLSWAVAGQQCAAVTLFCFPPSTLYTQKGPGRLGQPSQGLGGSLPLWCRQPPGYSLTLRWTDPV